MKLTGDFIVNMKKIIFLLVFLFIVQIVYSQAATLFFPGNTSDEFVNKTEANKILREIANEYLHDQSLYTGIKIIAYAADTPSDIDGWLLSEERAAFIQNELVLLGIDKKNIDISGSGPTSEWGNNSSEEERMPNRRANIILIKNIPIISAENENIDSISILTDPVTKTKSDKFKFDFNLLIKIIVILLVILAIIALVLLIGYYFAPIAAAIGGFVNFFIGLFNKIPSIKLPSFKVAVRNPLKYSGKGSDKYISGLRNNVRYTAGEGKYKYTTDHLGRIDTVYAKKLIKTQRPSRNHQWREIPGKLPTDDSGHLISDRTGGAEDLRNLIAQNRNINRGAYKSMENKLYKQITPNSAPSMKINIQHSGDSMRPELIRVNTVEGGRPNAYIFKNP